MSGGIEIASRRFAHAVTIELPGTVPEDNGFHLAPEQTRTIALTRIGTPKSGTVTCANAEVGVRVEVKRA